MCVLIKHYKLYFRTSGQTMSYCMISQVKECKLIAIYLYICNIYKGVLMYSSLLFSNNSYHAFTDSEIMTIYLYALNIDQQFKIKQIY